MALIGSVAESFLVFYALNFTTAARTSLIANCSPIITVVLAFLMLKEKTSKLGLLGMLIGFSGIAVAVVSRGGDLYADTGMRSLIGDGMALASGACWSYFTVSGSPVSKKYGAAVCMFLCFILGSVILIPTTLFLASPAEVLSITPRIWGGLLYTAVFTLALANALWFTALKYLNSVVVGAFGYLSAATTFTLSAVMLKEKFSLSFIFSIVLVLGGMTLMMVKSSGKQERTLPDPE